MKSIFSEFAFFRFFRFKKWKKFNLILNLRHLDVKNPLFMLSFSKIVQEVDLMFLDRIRNVLFHNDFVVQFLGLKLRLWKNICHFQGHILSDFFYSWVVLHVCLGQEEQFLWDFGELRVRLLILGLVQFDFFYEVLTVLKNLPFKES